jgi:DNA-binding CsgD family transcriptional regulator
VFLSNILSPRLRECLILAREGHTAVEIAYILGLSFRTVNQYLSDAYKRLGARNRMQAVTIAVQRGEIPPVDFAANAPSEPGSIDSEPSDPSPGAAPPN